MKLVKTFLIACLIPMMTAYAGEDGDELDRPSLRASRTEVLVAEVDAIDHETREVTLSTEEESVTFTASEDVRNLAQIEVGDLVIAEYHEEIEIDVYANPDGLEPGAGALAAVGRADEGAMPGAGGTGTVVITAVVEAIDLENETFTLRGPLGNSNTFAARDPANLRRAKVGDLVVIQVTASAGILVERPAGE